MTTKEDYQDHCAAIRALCRWFQSQGISLHQAIGMMMHTSGIIIADAGSRDDLEDKLQDAIQYLVRIARVEFKRERTN